jgi:hypothetical protein
MKNLRTLGIAAPQLQFENVPLVSDINLYEFDMIVYQPWGVFSGKETTSYAKAAPIRNKLTEITEWVKRGNTIIVVLSRVPAAKYNEHDRVSGSLGYVNLLTAPLFDGAKFTPIAGSRIENAGSQSAAVFFDPIRDQLKYAYIISHAAMRPLLRVSGAATNSEAQIVAGWIPQGAGRVVLVPPIDADPSSASQGNYINSLPTLLNCLESQRHDLPSWIDRWRSAEAWANLNKIGNARTQIEKIENEIAHHQSLLSQERWLYDLFAETGELFASAVKAAFVELGFIAVDGPHPRADILVRLDDKIGVIEAKGLEGSAKETNLRQAERWIAEVNHTLAASPEERRRDADLRRYGELLETLNIPLDVPFNGVTKGIMVIGTFRKTPLDERIEASFPDQLLRPLNRSFVCALTGLQLFTMVMASRRDPTLRIQFAQSVLSANGVYVQDNATLQWTNHLTEKGDDDPETVNL